MTSHNETEYALDCWVQAEIKNKYIILSGSLAPHMKKFIDTEAKCVRNALIKLGWTPPSCIEKDCTNPDCSVCYTDPE